MSEIEDFDDDCFKEIRIAPAFMCPDKRREFLHNKVKNLPEHIQEKIIVLKNIQLDYIKLEEEFFQKLYALESEYHDRYQQLHDKRHSIIAGTVEPPTEKPKFNAITEDGGSDDTLNEWDYAVVEDFYVDVHENCKGIPNFWLTILKNVKAFAVLIHERDESVLKKLNDIKSIFDKVESFTIEFHFDQNEYFSNSVLTRKYYLRTTADKERPFSFDGLEMYKTEGCTIEWYKGMSLTQGVYQTNSTDECKESFESFFDIFNVSDSLLNDEENLRFRDIDFELAYFIRDKLIPRAILYFTGDIIDDGDNAREFGDFNYLFDDSASVSVSEESAETIENTDIGDCIGSHESAY